MNKKGKQAQKGAKHNVTLEFPCDFSRRIGGFGTYKGGPNSLSERFI